MTRRVTCKCHCRDCGSHFTSLAAFDAHLSGKPGTRVCEFAPDAFRELSGVCSIGYAEARGNVTVYEHVSAERARAHFAQ